MSSRSLDRHTVRAAGLGLLLLALAAGCSLFFNQEPIARIVTDVLSGGSPLVVTLDASTSSDEDGTIISYTWDFGDGSTDTGATVQHVFTTATDIKRYTVTLTVTDDDGATSQAKQTIEVRVEADGAAGTGLPTAWFSAAPWIGAGPLTVHFDARESTPGDGTIAAYNWNFGDNGEGTGSQPTHTYSPAATTEYLVTLFVWNSQDQVDIEQRTVIVVVPGAQTGDDPPVAEVTATDPILLYESETRPDIPSLYEITFDPRGSSANAGHDIEYFAWDFGDGDTHVETSDLEVTHVYELRAQSRTYIMTLTVFDDQGEQDVATLNITLTDAD